MRGCLSKYGRRNLDVGRVVPRVLAISLAAAALFVAPSVASAAPADASRPCELSAPRGEARVDGVSPTGGRETTEFYSDGSYTVTRCGKDGALEISETVSALRIDDRIELSLTDRTVRRGGLLRTDFLTYGLPLASEAEDGSTGTKAAPERYYSPAVKNASDAGVEIVFSPGGEPPLPPGSGDRTSSGSGAEEPEFTPFADDTCTNGEYHVYIESANGKIARWPFPANQYTYFTNVASMAGGTAWREQLVRGHHTWNDTFNSCGFTDQTTFTAYHGGGTSLRANPSSDGTSVVDFGSLDPFGVTTANTLAFTRIWWQYDSSFTDIVETDQRYESPPQTSFCAADCPWSTNGAAGAWDLFAFGSHESGHSLGLRHATSSEFGWLTMSPTTYRGAIRWRDLGKGDVSGLRRLYP